MKTHKYLYRKMLDEEIIRQAYKNLRKGKTKRVEIRYIDANLDAEVQKMRLMIENTKPCPVEHPELAFRPKHHKPKIIHEHGKERRIYMPEMREQWLHHIIILVLSPIVMATAHPYTCGSYPKRGAHYGKRVIEKWIRRAKNSRIGERSMRYYAKLDIRHFYDSISHKVLFRELRNRIKDEWFLYVISVCIQQFRKGLPLGFYISQWLANYMLEPLDYLISKKYPKFLRYMDDMVFYGSSVKQLKQMINAVSRMLGHRFYLKLKGNYQVIKFLDGNSGRCLDYMGFLFYRDKTLIRKSIMLKATKLAKRIRKIVNKGYRVYRKLINAFLSYNGWFKHTNSYGCYLKRIKPFVSIGLLKRIVSFMDRRRNRDRMDKSEVLGAA